MKHDHIVFIERGLSESRCAYRRDTCCSPPGTTAAGTSGVDDEEGSTSLSLCPRVLLSAGICRRYRQEQTPNLRGTPSLDHSLRSSESSRQ